MFSEIQKAKTYLLNQTGCTTITTPHAPLGET